MRKSRYDEAKGGENKRRRLVKSFSAIESNITVDQKYVLGWVFSGLYVGKSVLNFSRVRLLESLCFAFGLLFIVCWGVGDKFFSHALHGSMLGWLICECEGTY